MADRPDNQPGPIKKVLSKFNRANVFKELLSTPTFQLGRAGRFVVFQIKLWSHCARLLKKNRAGQQAAALSYYTIFGIVPLAIVILMLFQSLGADTVGQNVKQLVYEHLELTKIVYSADNGQQIVLTEHLDAIVQQFYEGLDKGSLTFISGVIVIWAALALLSKIEKAFNNIWHVARGRTFVHRIINYWAILTLGPLLIGLGVYITAQYKSVSDIQKTILTVSSLGPTLMYYGVAAFVLFLLYYLLPNTKVGARGAIWGACCAALLWMFAKWGFSEYVTKFIPYSQIYGVVGLVPLAVLWIFITWLIVLFGLQVTFTTQHLSTLDADEIASGKKADERFIANDVTAINVVRTIAAAFEQDSAPLETEALCGTLDLPGEFGQKILDHLVNEGIILKTSDPRAGYVPAKDPANIKLSEIARAVAAVGFAQSNPERADKLDQIVNSQHSALAKYTVKQIVKTEPRRPKTTKQKTPERKPPEAPQPVPQVDAVLDEHPPSPAESS